ncbi:putative ankyrin repeat protein RF_0381 [Phymastichus coffea]|uniref:putative ankyrin repeat protein RF_0381 n=1 Tax=Phymastichus coffea TaxID=108790 RepID=UPI00273CD500|nr:putative ankyrin repeat protein RF_0381 [Phymastichus coffea]
MMKNILDKEDTRNQVILTNVFQDFSQPDITDYTILHIAAIKRDVEAFKILIDNRADFTMQNAHEFTVLHYLFECTADNSRIELINYALSAHLKLANSSNPCNNNGITHFHIACMVNNTQAVQFFLENAASVRLIVKMDSPRFPGYSSLHFASEGCSIETIKLLLKNDIDINVKNAQGRTALHIFVQQKINLCDSLRYSEIDATTVVLDKIDLMDNATNLLLPDNGIDNVGFSQFHSACTMRESTVAEDLIEQVTDINRCVLFDSPVWPGYTGLHFAAHYNMKIFQMLVQKIKARTFRCYVEKYG